jgi:HAD superfamily hydrolase (TIGR01509 family)
VTAAASENVRRLRTDFTTTQQQSQEEELGQRRPSYVVFDVGNVLVHIDPPAFLRSLSLDAPEYREYYQPKIIDVVMNYERGTDSTEIFFANLVEIFNGQDRSLNQGHKRGHSFSRNDFQTAMLSIIGEQVAGMEEIVQRVGSSVPLGLLSNTNPIHFQYCLQWFPILQHFPSRFLSYQLKAVKPEPEIFARVREQVPFPPSAVLYIDDLVENIDAARSAGFWSHQFFGVENIEQLFTDLKLL